MSTSEMQLPDGAADASEPGDGSAPKGPRAWRDLYPPRPKPPGVDYGFLSARGEPVPSTRENLLHLARTRALPSLAWAPETEEMVPPWEVPFLLDAMRQGLADRARREIRIVLAVAAALVLALLVIDPTTALVIGIILVPGLAVLVAVMWRRVRAGERLSAQELNRAADALVDNQTELAQPIPFTRALTYPLLGAGAAQIFFYGASLDAGALDGGAVAAGEWWRLLTAPVLHGGFWHFFLNYGALESLGRTMETRGVRGYVPLVFAASALAGGAASLALPPEVRSVGASGGLMGMFGFLAVLGWRRKRNVPEGFLRGLLINIALIALVGAFAYRFIDNAAHAGGMLAGVLIGLAAVPHDQRVPEWRGGPLVEQAGRAAIGLVWLSAAAAVAVTLLRVTA